MKLGPENLRVQGMMYGPIEAGGAASFRAPTDATTIEEAISDEDSFAPRFPVVSDGCTTRGTTTNYYAGYSIDPVGSLTVQVFDNKFNGPAHVRTVVTPEGQSPIIKEFPNLQPGTSVEAGDGIVIYNSAAPNRS